MKKTLVYCGEKKDIKSVKNLFDKVVYIDINNDLLAYLKVKRSAEPEPLHKQLIDYDHWQLKDILPSLEAIESKAVVIAGNLYYWNTILVARTLQAIQKELYGAFIKPLKMENRTMFWLAEGFIQDNLGIYKNYRLFDSEKEKDKQPRQYKLDIFLKERQKALIESIKEMANI